MWFTGVRGHTVHRQTSEYCMYCPGISQTAPKKFRPSTLDYIFDENKDRS